MNARYDANQSSCSRLFWSGPYFCPVLGHVIPHSSHDLGPNNLAGRNSFIGLFLFVKFQEKSVFIKRISVPSLVNNLTARVCRGALRGTSVKKVARLSLKVLISWCFYLPPQHAAHNSLSNVQQESNMAGFLNHYPPYPVNGLNMPPRTADMFSPMVAPPYGELSVFIFRL